MTENVYPLRPAWYEARDVPAPKVELAFDPDATYRGLFVPGQMTDGQRLQAAVRQAVELGYDTDVLYVDADEVVRYAQLQAARGFAVRAWIEPIRECSFVFRDSRQGPAIERPDDV